MKTTNLLLILAIAASAVSLVNFLVTLTTVEELGTVLTGLVTGTGLVNFTVESQVNINFSSARVLFGSGRVTFGKLNATLQTDNNGITNGNWSFSGQKLMLDNIGTVNLSLNLSVDATAATYLGGTTPLYQWNVTNADKAACINVSTAVSAWNVYGDANNTATRFCEPLQFLSQNNSIRIDFYLRVPEDSLKGERTSTLTATALVAA